jgi:hypothetical protein
MKYKLIYRWALFFLGIGCFVNAQNKQLQAFTLEDGLPQSQVHAITQDQNGYLWLGTQGGGLARFDGARFTVYDDVKGLGSNYINAIQSNNDTLYIGTKQGLSVKIKQKFVHIDTPEIVKISVIGDQIVLLTVQGLYSVTEDLLIKKLQLHQEIDDVIINDILFYDGQFLIATQLGLWESDRLLAAPQHIKKIIKWEF